MSFLQANTEGQQWGRATAICPGWFCLPIPLTRKRASQSHPEFPSSSFSQDRDSHPSARGSSLSLPAARRDRNVPHSRDGKECENRAKGQEQQTINPGCQRVRSNQRREEEAAPRRETRRFSVARSGRPPSSRDPRGGSSKEHVHDALRESIPLTQQGLLGIVAFAHSKPLPSSLSQPRS